MGKIFSKKKCDFSALYTALKMEKAKSNQLQTEIDNNKECVLNCHKENNDLLQAKEYMSKLKSKYQGPCPNSFSYLGSDSNGDLYCYRSLKRSDNFCNPSPNAPLPPGDYNWGTKANMDCPYM